MYRKKIRGGENYDAIMAQNDRDIIKDVKEADEVDILPDLGSWDNFDDRYILVFARTGLDTEEQKIGFVFFDISVLHFYVGCFDDPKKQIMQFKTLV